MSNASAVIPPVTPHPTMIFEPPTPWAAVADEAMQLLREYVRIPSVNDPLRLTPQQSETSPWLAGREAEAAGWMAGVLQEQGIRAELFESAPGRVNLMARLAAAKPEQPPLVLLSHSDVAPAARIEWDPGVDPFSGAIRRGFIYGRGVLDLKGLGVAHMMIFTLLHRLRVPLKRDVVLLVTADEQAGGVYGLQWMLEHRPELRQSGLALGKGGFSVQGLWQGRDVHAIAVAEKGVLELECIADSKGHHASIIPQDTAPARLVRALNRVLALETPIRITGPIKKFFEEMANAIHGPEGFLLKLPGMKPRMTARHLSRIPAVNAMVRDTISLTVLESGLRGGFLPGQARAVLSILLLPGSDPKQMRERIRRELEKDGVHLRQLAGASLPANSSDFNTPEFAALARHAAGNRGGVVVPTLSPCVSDGRIFRCAGIPCYGWVPFPVSEQDLGTVNGANERVALRSFEQGMRNLYRGVVEIAGSSS